MTDFFLAVPLSDEAGTYVRIGHEDGDLTLDEYQFSDEEDEVQRSVAVPLEDLQTFIETQLAYDKRGDQ